MATVFISYRRDDSAGHAGRLSDRLVARFGASHVFMDVDDIQPGQNFEQAIEQTLSRCEHVLAVVGPRWLEILRARQAVGEDFVEHEIAAALASGRSVIPILVGGARMPSAEQLPPELVAFARCNALEIRDHRFDDDAAELIRFLAGGVDRRKVVGASAAGVALLALAYGAYAALAPPPAPAGTSAVAPAPTIDGTWQADLQKPGQRTYPVRFTFVRDADRLRGTVSYPTGDAAILDGRYVDGRFTFRTEHLPQFSSDLAVIRTEGQFDGATVQLIMTDPAGVATGVARRLADTQQTARSLPALAYGTWTLHDAVDDQKKDWSNSVLQFTSQEATADGLLLKGRFTWRLDGELFGTEDVQGRYLERTRQVIVEGVGVTNAAPAGQMRLAVGSYSAVLSPDERTLADGRWGSTADHEPGYAGRWTATR